ncbi:hypothetical protein X777_08546, partial [Ooceraea biroi]
TSNRRQQEHPERGAVHLGAHREHDRTSHLAEGGQPRPERRHGHQGHPDGQQRVEEVAELQDAQSHDAHAVHVLSSFAGVVERREEHDRGVSDRLGEVLASHRHVDRADEREVAQGQGEQLQQDAASVEDVAVVAAVEAAVATGAVASREHEAATHVVHALPVTAAATLDARRGRDDALDPGGSATGETLARATRLRVAPRTGATAGAVAAADRCFVGAEDAQTDVPSARFRVRHVHVRRLGRVDVHVRRGDALRANAGAAGSDVGVVACGRRKERRLRRLRSQK